MNNKSEKLASSTMTAISTALLMNKLFNNWSAEFSDKEALEFVRRCECYNRITRQGLVGLVEQCIEAAPESTSPGISNIYFRIGNEGSMVIYAHFKKFYTKLDEHKESVLIGRCKEISQLAKADEFSVDKNDFHELVFRFWWD